MSDTPTIGDITDAASAARQNSYSPYSRFKVGAAILGDNGKIYSGTNVENASFGLTNCAERSAIFAAISDGCRNFEAMVVVTADGSTSCGACRQIMTELCPSDMPVVFYNEDNSKVKIFDVGELLPNAFSLR